MVDFALTDENRLVQAAARAFAEREILPHIRRWDEEGSFPREMFAKLAEQGFLGAPIPEAWGGSGMDYHSFGIIADIGYTYQEAVRRKLLVEANWTAGQPDYYTRNFPYMFSPTLDSYKLIDANTDFV